jgi:phenylacetate-CoA ligase
MPHAIIENQEIDRWSGERIRGYQLERVREVIAWAWERVPLYRRLWERAGIDSPAIASLETLERFPLVSKEHLMKGRDHWGSDGNVGFSTRGTSGEPLLVWLNRDEEELFIVPTVRGFRWAGFQPGMTALLSSPIWHRLAACEAHAVARLGGRCAFFWGSMDADYIDSFLDTAQELRPEFVTSTAPLLHSAIRRAAERKLELSTIFGNVRSAVVAGLPLTPRSREFLRDRLGVGDVFERGGTQEGAALDECAIHTAPHVHEDVCALEVVDASGAPVLPEVRGELVVTKLSTQGSVFIRYRTGDIAAFVSGECGCGSTFRRLKIYGRPESSIIVGGHRVTAYDVRKCVEEDDALVGRNLLLVRSGDPQDDALGVAIEGNAVDPEGLVRRLKERLEVPAATVTWLGGVRVNWGFRQVVGAREISALGGARR